MSRFQGLMCPTILCGISAQKLGTERVPKVQIYMQKKTIASKQLLKHRKIHSHI